MTLSEESKKSVLELDRRLRKAFMDSSEGRGLEDEREAFLPEDFSTLHQAIRELDPVIQRLVRIYEGVAKQLARGERCAVCGMTDAQSKAANYDCTQEC